MTPFEQKLAATPRRELPPKWRAEILARAASRRAGILSSLGTRALRGIGILPMIPRTSAGSRCHILRPAWGALAAAWIVIAILNVSGPNLRTTPEQLAQLERQRALLLALSANPLTVRSSRLFPHHDL